MGVGPYEHRMLALFGAHVHRAFGHVPFHVGSSLTEKRGWRDVDVRLMLPDDEFAALFGHDGVKVSLWNMAWSALGRAMTGLPVDFQFQDTTSANADHDGVRGALLVFDLPVVARTDKQAPQ